jgi:Fructose-bisphosphate aldolase class-II
MNTLKDVLQQAERDRVAVGHLIFRIRWRSMRLRATARALNVPVMVGVSEGERAFVGVRRAAALVRSVREEYGQAIFINADHTHSIAKAEEAAKAGFDEIIFDGSGLHFEDNFDGVVFLRPMIPNQEPGPAGLPPARKGSRLAFTQSLPRPRPKQLPSNPPIVERDDNWAALDCPKLNHR